MTFHISKHLTSRVQKHVKLLSIVSPNGWIKKLFIFMSQCSKASGRECSLFWKCSTISTLMCRRVNLDVYLFCHICCCQSAMKHFAMSNRHLNPGHLFKIVFVWSTGSYWHINFLQYNLPNFSMHFSPNMNIVQQNQHWKVYINNTNNAILCSLSVIRVSHFQTLFF